MKSLLHPVLLLSGLLVVPAVLAAPATETRNFPARGVTHVVLETPGSLDIRPGKAEQLTVEAEPKVMQKLDVSVSGHTLYLRSKGDFKTEARLHFSLEIPRLNGLEAQGSGDARVGAFRVDELDVNLAGSGDVSLDGVQAASLDLKLTGSGNLKALGHGDSLRAEISGSGDIAADGYAVARADAMISGSGEIRVHASDRLQASIDGSGNILYGGHPKLNQNISGAGSVDPL